jgi:hypothetical protein
MTVRHIAPRLQALDLLGEPAPGAKLRFYDAGTTTPRTVYSDSGASIAISQPVIADSAGFFVQIYLQTGAYKTTLHSSADVLLETADNLDPGLSTGAGALAVASGGTGATTAAGARSNLGAFSQVAGDALDTRVADLESITDNPILAASVTQTYAASFTPVHTSAETRDVTLTGNITINAPTVTAGQFTRLILIQDATGSRTWSVNSAYKFPGGYVPPLSTTASAVDVLEGYARTTGIIEVTSFKRQDPLTNVAILEDQKAQNTAGGTFTSGADRVRDLNTEVSDPDGIVSIAANQFTLGAGKYEIDWSAPANQVAAHQSFLYNVTDTAEVKRGSSETAPTGTGVTIRSVGSAIVTISASKAFEIRHRCTTTAATNGFGEKSNFGIEVYTRVRIARIA